MIGHRLVNSGALNSKICEEIGMAAKLNKITIYITSTEVFFNRDADGNRVFDEKLYKKAYNIVTEVRRSKADKLRFNEDKCRCIAAGLLLNYALRQEKVDNHSEIVMVDIIKACDGYDKVDIEKLLNILGQQNICSILVEGGATLSGSFVAKKNCHFI